MANSLRRKLGSDFNVAQSIWNAELLRSPKLRGLAASEARESDLVIIATNEGAPISAELASWFRIWGRRHRKIPSALVALLNKAGRESSRVVEESLHRWAERAKMEFFCHSEPVAVENELCALARV